MAREEDFLKGCSETIVLTLLAVRPMYGYELVQEIARRSQGVFTFPQGTVYPLLYSLERKGLVRSAWNDSKEKKGIRPRKYYRLTISGRSTVRKDVGYWKSLVKGMSHVLRRRYGTGAEAVPG